MGSGKTHSVLGMVKCHPTWTVLFISCRIAYTKSLAEDCKKRGIEVCSYLEASQHELNTAQRVIIQLDSLPRLEDRNQSENFDLVVFDEITELSAHPDSEFLRYKAPSLVLLLQSVACFLRANSS